MPKDGVRLSSLCNPGIAACADATCAYNVTDRYSPLAILHFVAGRHEQFPFHVPFDAPF